MPTLYDVAHLVAWNGYAKDMIPYLGVDKAAWNNDEFWFPHVANFRHGPKKKTRLQRICERSYVPFRRVKQLLAYGANPDVKDEEGNSPLIICCKSSIFDLNSNGKYKYACLAHDFIDTIEILINAGADVNQCKTGFTPMHLAAKGGNIDIVKLLLANGADVNIRNSRDGYPIDLAAKEGHMEIIKLLIKGGAIITDDAIYNAIDGDHDSILSYITKMHPAPADSIYKAVCDNSAKVIQTLAKMGGDVNFIKHDKTLVERSLDAEFTDDMILRQLCKAGANLNITSLPNAMPPIFLALSKTYLSGVKLLCTYGVDVNILYDVSRTGYYVTPIIYILTKRGYTDSEDQKLYEIFKALLPLSDLTLADSEGKTPLEHAKKHSLHNYERAIDFTFRKRKKASA